MRPTNPRSPAKLTAAPAKSAATPSMTKRTRPTFMPTLRATSSPMRHTLSALVPSRAATSPAAIKAAGHTRSVERTPARPPTKKVLAPT